MNTTQTLTARPGWTATHDGKAVDGYRLAYLDGDAWVYVGPSFRKCEETVIRSLVEGSIR